MKKNKKVKPAMTLKAAQTLTSSKFERLLSDISARFIDLPHEHLHSAIDNALERVGRALDVDRCSLLEFHKDPSVDPNLYYYCASGIEPASVAGPPSPDSYLRKMMREGMEICFSKLDELPQEAMVDLEYLESRGVKSAFLIPVRIKNRTATALVFSGIRSECVWPEKLKPRLRLLADVFTRVLVQKKTEANMVRSEERFRQFFKNLSDYACIVSSEGIVLNVNDSALDALGYERNELVGRSLATIFAPESYQKIKKLLDGWQRDAPIHNEEMVIITKSGKKRFVLLNVSEVGEEDGGIMHLAMMLTDITERKADEEAILGQSQFTETAINSVPGIFYVYNSDWRMVHWNRNHESLTGFSAEELKGRMVLDWFPEEFKDTVAAAIRQVFDEGEAMVEAPLTMKDGSQVPYLFKGVSLDIAGKAYFTGMGMDISQLKANEEALEKSEQQLRLITDSLPALISYVDSSQRYIFVNKSYADFVGLPRDQILGKELRDVLGEDLFENVRERVAKVLSGQSITFEITVPSSRSEPRHMLAMYVPDFREGDIHGFFASIHDVTDLEKAKKQARDAHMALYHFGRVKTLEALSSSISHEMQQPLTGILSNAQAIEMLLEDPQPDMDEVKGTVKDIVADAKRAGGVMWQLRAFLRKQDTNLQLLNLNTLIEDVLSVLNSDMVIHNVLVVKHLAADLPEVVGDDVQLKQVLMNLVVNAQQAMEESASEVHRLVIRTSMGGAGKITVCIEDSGSGIEEGKFKHIFEPFFTTRQDGTGMGLAISRFIIEAHRGQMWAENQAEGGAKVGFNLPVAGGSFK